MNKDIVVAKLVHTRGSAPQEVGARIVVSSEGLLHGTVGGGKVEMKVIAHAKEMLASEKQNDFQEWNLQTDVGMTCGGVVSFFFERLSSGPRWKIAVFGAGHVGQELIRTLIRLECSLMCFDSRQEWLDKLPDHPYLIKECLLEPAEKISDLDPDTFIISMTMGHAFDLPILTAALKRETFPYIGAIGSRAKATVLKRDLKTNGISDSALEKLYCPIGEEFGNNTPTEIAISIVAQLLRVRDQNGSKRL